jgi:hypothetical protein
MRLHNSHSSAVSVPLLTLVNQKYSVNKYALADINAADYERSIEGVSAFLAIQQDVTCKTRRSFDKLVVLG